jgi:hypothetical protein
LSSGVSSFGGMTDVERGFFFERFVSSSLYQSRSVQ